MGRPSPPLVSPDRRPLILWPSSARGWFGGRAVVAWAPISVRHDVSLADAAAALETAYTAEKPVLVAVLAAYHGRCTLVRYAGALVGEADGWRPWGVLNGADEVLIALEANAPSPIAPIPPAEPLLRDAAWDLHGRDFRAAVDTVRDRIAAGDVYVLNLTARLEGEPVLTPSESFSALVDRAGSEMNAYFDGWPGHTPWLASVSPERFLRIVPGEHEARLVEVCPIKGTRPRGATSAADTALASGLASDAKELAEHIMVVDLERNDLGVACAPGTVHVDPLYEVAPTPYCHQLVSTVRGTLRSGASFADLLGATFPCGSVTGAPKRAAVRIAAELERSERGAYCGSLLVAMPGALDSSVLIRTLEGVESAGGPSVARWGAGCGITYDSDPVAEQLETLLKASPATGDGAPPLALRETMRIVGGRVPLLDRHLARLAGGGVGPSLLARVRDAVAEQLAATGAAAEAGAVTHTRLSVTVRPDGATDATLSAAPSSLAVPGDPVLVPVEIAASPVLPPQAAKPAEREHPWDVAHREALAAGGHQALLHLPDSTLIDGSTATVWLVSRGTLLTPPAPPAVSGVCRELVFDLARTLEIRAEERLLNLEDLAVADEVFLGNALGGVVPVRGRGGPITRRIAAEVERALLAEGVGELVE